MSSREQNVSLDPRALERAIWLPNLLLIFILLTIAFVRSGAQDRISPLVTTDRHSSASISELEVALKKWGYGHSDGAMRLARLYARAGELAWAYDTLSKAEAHRLGDLPWRLKLGLTYLEIGRNEEGLRVLNEAQKQCDAVGCESDIRARLNIGVQTAEKLLDTGIDGRKQQQEASESFRQVVKSVKISTGRKSIKIDAGPKE